MEYTWTFFNVYALISAAAFGVMMTVYFARGGAKTDPNGWGYVPFVVLFIAGIFAVGIDGLLQWLLPKSVPLNWIEVGIAVLVVANRLLPFFPRHRLTFPPDFKGPAAIVFDVPNAPRLPRIPLIRIFRAQVPASGVLITSSPPSFSRKRFWSYRRSREIHPHKPRVIPSATSESVEFSMGTFRIATFVVDGPTSWNRTTDPFLSIPEMIEHHLKAYFSAP